MSQARIDGRMRSEIPQGRDNAAAGAIHILSLAAAPTFAIMAVLNAAHTIGASDVLCSAAPHASPLNGMGVMYLLMSAFHAAPWLKLMSSLRPRLEQNGALTGRLRR